MRIFWAGIILIVGLIIVLQTAGVISGNFWGYFWGGLLIIMGIAMFMGRSEKY